MENYDVIIIGGGPAGLSAGLYAGRARLNTLLIERQKFGGQIVITNELENYPGCLEGESGPSIIDRMVSQNEKFGVKHIFDTVTDVDFSGETKTVTCLHGTYGAKAIIIASGAHPMPIGCPGEKELSGKGVSYCATCDAALFEDFDVYVVGGGDSAIQEAIYLTKFARKVTVIHRRDQLRAAKSLQEKAFANPKISFMWDSVVEKIEGDGLVESMSVKNVKTGEITKVDAPEEDGTFGIFVFIGYKPNSDLFRDKVALDDRGYIVTDADMKTNVPGVFAAGDIREKSLRQVVTAAADGAVAAVQAERYIEG